MIWDVSSNGFWGVCAAEDYKTVVPVGDDEYHAFDTFEDARFRCQGEHGIPGFWRLKERKA